MNATSVYINEKLKDINGNIINPATQDGLDMIVQAIDWFSLTDSPLIQGENWELFTRDMWLERVLWTQSLLSKWNLKTTVVNENDSINFAFAWLWTERRVAVSNYSTCVIQLSWTWVWTVWFEVTSNGADFLWVSWVNLLTNSIAQASTGNWIFKFNVSWLKYLRLRMAAYTSWTVFANFSLSSWEQQQPLSQRATTFELNTFDTNLQSLPTAIGTTQMYQTGMEIESVRIIEPTINPTQPTAYAAPKFANYPQKFRRLRVEAAWNQRLPFAQEINTNRLIVSTPEVYRILEEVLLALSDIRDILKNSNNLDSPSR